MWYFVVVEWDADRKEVIKSWWEFIIIIRVT